MSKIVIKLKSSAQTSALVAEKNTEVKNKISKSWIENNFYKPILNLMKNEGYNENGVLIADQDGLCAIEQILSAIINQEEKNPIEIIEDIVLSEECDENQEIFHDENILVDVSDVLEEEFSEEEIEESENDEFDEDEEEEHCEEDLCEESCWDDEDLENEEDYDRYLHGYEEEDYDD